MGLFAEEPFWKPPNVYDAFGVVGVVLALASIWYAWYLARRDIRQRIDNAVAGFLQSLTHTDISDAIQSLRLARAKCENKKWSVGRMYCETAFERLGRLIGRSDADSALVPRLSVATQDLRELLDALRRNLTDGRGDLPVAAVNRLADVIERLVKLEGELQTPSVR